MIIKIRGFFWTVFSLLALIVGIVAFPAECVADEPDPSELYSKAAVLLDAGSGRVLYGKCESEILPMASTTKIMTCILALEQLSLEDTVPVSQYAAGMPKVKLYVKAGESYRVKDLLYSLMLESHNDTAAVLGEAIGQKLNAEHKENKEKDKAVAEDGRSLEESKKALAAFARCMNEKAVEIGCKDTWFITPNGLDATQELTMYNELKITKKHSTTAKELAMIMAYCVCKSEKREEFLNITQTRNYSFYANNRAFHLTNHNALLDSYEGVISGKTGFTNQAGYCYVGALRHEDNIYIIALLACGWPNNRNYKWRDARLLFRYGTENYSYRFLAPCDKDISSAALKPIPVLGGQTVSIDDRAYVNPVFYDSGEEKLTGLLMKEGEEVEIFVERDHILSAPIEAGRHLGVVRYLVDGVVYREDELVAKESIPARDLTWYVTKVLEMFMMKTKK